MKYVIHKNSRLPNKKSYSGPTWDKAGIRHLYKEQYDNKKEAIRCASCLVIFNPVGFKVSEVS